MNNEFVSVKPVIVLDTPDAHQVWLDVGCQHFTIGEYCETKEEAEWLAAQLRIALTALQAGAGDGMQGLIQAANTVLGDRECTLPPKGCDTLGLTTAQIFRCDLLELSKAIDNAQATEGK